MYSIKVHGFRSCGSFIPGVDVPEKNGFRRRLGGYLQKEMDGLIGTEELLN